jgi:hypothetical protein
MAVQYCSPADLRATSQLQGKEKNKNATDSTDFTDNKYF